MIRLSFLSGMAAFTKDSLNTPARAFVASFGRGAFQPQLYPQVANTGGIPRFYKSSDADDWRNNVADSASPSLEAPVLLLEGDEFFVSHDGISRTMYRLCNDCAGNFELEKGVDGNEVMVEELYHLKSAQKSYMLRQPPLQRSPGIYGQTMAYPSPEVLGKSVQGVLKLGPILEKIQVQEIDQGVFGSAGTGSTTWESSICMALFFALKPCLLVGDVIELGSGVGVGGILTQRVAACADYLAKGMNSFTLTDNNDEVLDQCKENVNKFASSCSGTKQVTVGKLDWYDFVEASNKKKYVDSGKKYDTLVGSDICYCHSQIAVLSQTVAHLLKTDGRAKLHLFGPLNRSALQDLVRELKVVRGMDVSVECIEMERFRLKPVQPRNQENLYGRQRKEAQKNEFDEALDNLLHEEDCLYASKNVAKILHITVSHYTVPSDASSAHGHEGRKMGDLD